MHSWQFSLRSCMLVLLMVLIIEMNEVVSPAPLKRPKMPDWKEPRDQKNISHHAYSLRPPNLTETKWINEDNFKLLSPLDSLSKCFRVGPQCFPRCRIIPNRDRVTGQACMPSIPPLDSLAAVNSNTMLMTSLRPEDVSALKEKESSVFYRWCIEAQILDQKPIFCMPSVIGIGPAKSGSTSLFGLLYEHPNVREPRRPGHQVGAGNIFEPGHFVDFDLVFAKGLPFYASFFPDNKHLSPKYVLGFRDDQIERYSFDRHSGDNIHPSRWKDPDNDAKSVRADVQPAKLILHSFHRSDFNVRKAAMEKSEKISESLNITRPLVEHKVEVKEFIFAEKSPWYISHPLAPFRIRALLPDVKIVATVREPVERAFSGFCHLFKTYFMNKAAKTPLTFTEIVDQGIQLVQEYRVCREEEFENMKNESQEQLSEFLSYDDIYDNPNLYDKLRIEDLQKIEEIIWYRCMRYWGTLWGYGWKNRFTAAVDEIVWYGMYYEHLRRWYRVFPREQIQIIHSDAFFQNTSDVMRMLEEWIGLPVQPSAHWDEHKNFNAKEDEIREGAKLRHSKANLSFDKHRTPEAVEKLRAFYDNEQDWEQLLE